MNKINARHWLRTFGDLPEELQQCCRRGHRECSTTHGGECLNDVLLAAAAQGAEHQSAHSEATACTP